MRIEYNDYQSEELIKRMSFLKSMRTCMWVVTAILLAVFGIGIALIYYHLAFLGVVIIFVDILPLIIAIGVLSYSITLVSSVNKKKYMCFEVECKDATPVEGNGLWKEITVGEKNMKVYYYSDTPHKELPAGTIVHTIVCKSKKRIMFAIEPIEEGPSNTTETTVTDNTTEKAE